MTRVVKLILGVCAAHGIVLNSAVQAMAFGNERAVGSTKIPGRLLTCVLGRATNLDPHREQKRSEVIYEGSHRFALYLPETSKRVTAPPDPTEPAEPVDPRTKIVADPDRLTINVPNRFDRVIDIWPERVEMTTIVADPVVNLIIVSDIAADGNSAYLFMTKASDVATLDLQNVYSGKCSVTFKQPGDS
ncbi:MAG: hypothetical protein ACO1OX_02610 [Novosphingobium sp.]